MLSNQLNGHTIILGSGSPRRRQFLKEMEIEFEVRVQSVEETYPPHLKGSEISDYLAELKASVLKSNLKPKEILITSDTVVWHKNRSLAKAESPEEAAQMLRTLSNQWHQVITSVCFTTIEYQKTVRQTTEVKFKELTEDEIDYYIEKYQPYDKAGAYGIQEWLGLIAIEEIKGSYTNVVGLPTQLVYSTLVEMVR